MDEVPGWNLVSGLGAGKFSRVYAAKTETSDFHVLKFLPRGYGGMGNNEHVILTQLANHKNVPTVIEFLQLADDASALILTPVGEPILPATTLFSPSIIFCTVLEVLEFAHNMNIIHRDVKPNNIFLDKSKNKIILNDWGSAVNFGEIYPYQGTPLYGEKNDGTHRPTKSLDLCSLVKAAFSINLQKFPNCGSQCAN